jgi:SAM-dependent methyltransferase
MQTEYLNNQRQPSTTPIRPSAVCPLCRSGSSKWFRLEHTSLYGCRNPRCQLQFANPQLDDESLGRAYEQFYYPAEGTYAPILENATERTVRQLLDAVAVASISPAGKRVLDYGCGFGTLLRVMHQSGADAVGIEQNAVARDSIHRAGFARAYATIDELLLNERAASFDLIFMCDVVEHLRTPWDDLRRLGSLLPSDGWIVVTTPNSESLRARLTGPRWDQRRNPTHFYYFAPQTLALVLHRAGFSRVSQLRTITDYEHHGVVRRRVQHLLANLGLQGGLLFIAGNFSLSKSSTF